MAEMLKLLRFVEVVVGGELAGVLGADDDAVDVDEVDTAGSAGAAAAKLAGREAIGGTAA